MRQIHIGGALAVILIGAVLRWAITTKIAGVNLDTLGNIFMAIGAVWGVFGIINALRTDRVVSRETVHGPAGQVQSVEREREF